jgi:hypothetical protein
MVMDEVMRNLTEGEKRGITWGLSQQLEDLNFAGNVCHLSHTFYNMKKNLRELENKGKAVRLKINPANTKTMRINTKSKERFEANNKDVHDVTEFTYLGNVVTTTGGAEDEVNIRVRKANAAFIRLYSMWKAKEMSKKTKMKIFSSNVKSVFLYGRETWKVTNKIINSLQAFINKRLRRILLQRLLQMKTYGS